MIENKRIVLTGASSGIGFEVLKLLAKGGNRIFAVGREIASIEEAKLPNVTAYVQDVSTKEGVDTVFEKAIEVLGGIDIFYANAGFAYYEQFDYSDWERMDYLISTNVISVMYAYSKMLAHLDGREGQFAITVSAMGKMVMPGFAVYAASKFGIQGFQGAVRLEKHKNMPMTCLYPVATDTRFFERANKIPFERPFPVQKADYVARKMVAGLEKKKKYVNPSKLFVFAGVLMTVFPFVRNIYWAMENAKFKRFIAKKAASGKSEK